jgi:broad specificity phosphatase PhoE
MAKRSSITLTVIRCGETTWEAQGRVHGVTDLPLSDAGRIAVTADLIHLGAGGGGGGAKISMIHHPPDEAATDTARLCAALLGAKLRESPELNDPNLGLLEGLIEQEFAERFRSRHKQWKEDPITLSPPEGEDIATAADRIFRGVAKIIRRSRGEEVALVLHDLGRSMLRCWIADRPLTAMREMEGGAGIERIALPLNMIDGLETAAKAIAPAN